MAEEKQTAPEPGTPIADIQYFFTSNQDELEKRLSEKLAQLQDREEVTETLKKLREAYPDFMDWIHQAEETGNKLLIPVAILLSETYIKAAEFAKQTPVKSKSFFDLWPLGEPQTMPDQVAEEFIKYLFPEAKVAPELQHVAQLSGDTFRQGVSKETQSLHDLAFGFMTPLFVGDYGKGKNKRDVFTKMTIGELSEDLKLALSKEEIPPDVAEQLSGKLTPEQFETTLTLASLYAEFEEMGGSGDLVMDFGMIAKHSGRQWNRHGTGREDLMSELEKVRTTPIVYDNDDEAASYGYDRLTIHSYLVNGDIIRAEKNGNVTDAFVMHGQSPLYTIAKNKGSKGQITAYPAWVRDIPLNRTVITTGLLNALLNWLTLNLRPASLKWETLFLNAGIKSRRNITRRKEYVEVILKYWSGDNEGNKHFISGYSITKDGITVPKKGVALLDEN